MSKHSQDKGSKNYQQRLAEHLEDFPYRADTVLEINRIVHVGHVSAESALEIIEVLETDHRVTDQEMNGLPAPDWYAECDRVFLPGEIGSVPTTLSRPEATQATLFSVE